MSGLIKHGIETVSGTLDFHNICFVFVSRPSMFLDVVGLHVCLCVYLRVLAEPG